MYLTHNATVVAGYKSLGYPSFMINILGTAKLLGALALLQPFLPKLREWAYAGFTFVLIGAIWTHIVTSTSPVAAVSFSVLLAVSYYFNIKANSASGELKRVIG